MSDNKIFGLGESNKVYKNEIDLFKMRIKTRKFYRTAVPFYFTYLDQINHNNKTPNMALLKSYVKVIILVRNPEDTFESIRLLSKKYYKEWSHQQIERYYIERLKFLNKIKSIIPTSQTIIINSDYLIDNSQQCLNEISYFLKLKTTLSSYYGIYPFTGRHGDPTPAINNGKIVKTKKQIYKKEISEECSILFEKIIGTK